MTTAEKNIALQEIKDAQQAIETLETEWSKAYKAGQPTDEIDKQIDVCLAKRNGMVSILTALKVKVDRRDYRVIGLNGEIEEIHTLWYLA